MEYGICRPDILLDEYDGHDKVAVSKKMRWTGIKHYRISFHWGRLQKYEDGHLVWDEEEVLSYREKLKKLPENSEILGLVLHPPKQVAESYLRNQATIHKTFSEFLTGLIERFPEIRAIEIWNEPNGSDFYLSVIDQNDNHRPWTASEFVRDIIIPGCKAVRKADPTIQIAAAPVAENGIIGHDDRPPAFTNQLANFKEYAQYKSKDPHGQFFFIKDFLFAYLTELKAAYDWNRTKTSVLFDIVSFHPYPYFQIEKKKNPVLHEITANITAKFIAVYDLIGFKNIEIWMTEIGARYFNIVKNNTGDEYQQANFLEKVFQNQEINERISRIYWYHFIDIPFDLRQEKPLVCWILREINVLHTI